MKPSRKTPRGLETANTRGGGRRYHASLDNACQDIDAESIDHCEDGCFLPTLLGDMSWRTPGDLGRRYPELIFSRVVAKDKPKGQAYAVRAAKAWTCARWRTAEDPR